MDTVIPKHVVQIWVSDTNEPLPQKWQHTRARTQAFVRSQGWQYYFIDNDIALALLKSHFPQYLDVYLQLPYTIERADMIRYVWMYVYGGIYFDLDMVPIRDFTELFTDHRPYMVQSSTLGGYITNMFIASAPKDQVWLRALEAIHRGPPWWALSPHLTVMYTTGSAMLTKTVKDKVNVLDSNLIYPCNVCQTEISGTCSIDKSRVYFDISGAQSHWNSGDSALYNFILCNHRCLQMVILLVIAGCLLYKPMNIEL